MQVLTDLKSIIIELMISDISNYGNVTSTTIYWKVTVFFRKCGHTLLKMCFYNARFIAKTFFILLLQRDEILINSPCKL